MTSKVSEKRNQNESGFVSLAFAGMLAIVMVTVIAQIVLNQQNQNVVHSSTRTQIIVEQRLRALALQFEEAAKQAEVRTTCPGGTTRRTIDGGEFCLPGGTGLCTTLTKVINGREVVEQFCTSLRASDLAWDDATSGNETLVVDPPSPITTGTRNRIRVPNTATSPLWQTCAAGETCLRILLCRNGALTCTFATAVAYQVVRF